jgi:spectinomycin phosphotransferase
MGSWQGDVVLERPDLAEDTLAGAVRVGWGLDVAGLEFMPLGLDTLAWAYDLRTATGERYFLKVRRGDGELTAVQVTRYLRSRGLDPVVAVIDTVSGQGWHRIDGYQLLLYPFVDGQRASATELTDQQWREYGAFLRDLHNLPAPPVPADRYVCAAVAGVRKLSEYVAQNQFHDQVGQELAESWREHDREIAELADRLETLGELVRAEHQPPVLCHADIHLNNILVSADGRLHVVDWDAPILAPRECDLMFVVGVATPDQETLFWQGYGPIAIDWVALAYYRYQRALEDIESFARDVLLRDDLGEATRAQNLYWFRVQFSPDGWVGLARSTEPYLA